MPISFDDPHTEPPTDMSRADVRAYEEKIVDMLRVEMVGKAGVFRVDAVELHGERPATQIRFRYTDLRTGDEGESVCDLWSSGYALPDDPGDTTLGSPSDVGCAIYTDWLGGFLDER